jgi:glucose-1-phosphate adenylyltransferase
VPGNTLAVVMAGGMGERLRPLTDMRTKPAVPFGGIYRIIDFTLSNCVNSGVRQIYVLTQYKSHSLTNHIRFGWGFLSRRLDQFIETIPAQMQMGDQWYAGTADALRQNQAFMQRSEPELVLVLAGDHIYKMDYRLMIRFHRERQAAVTVACVRVPSDTARGSLGVVEVDEAGRVIGFEEKPQEPKTIPGSTDCLASMGVYLFNYDALTQSLEQEGTDFGRHLLPWMVESGVPINAYDFTSSNRIVDYVHVWRDGLRLKDVSDCAPDSAYWRDVGTLDTYWQANLDLVSVDPPFNLYGELWPVFSRPQHAPPAKFVHEGDRTGVAINSIVSEGVIVSGALVRQCVLGPGTYIHSYAQIERSVLMGAAREKGTRYETTIGRHCKIRNAIIDKNVRLQEGTVLGYDRVADDSRGLVTQQIRGSDDYVVVVPRDSSL